MVREKAAKAALEADDIAAACLIEAGLDGDKSSKYEVWMKKVQGKSFSLEKVKVESLVSVVTQKINNLRLDVQNEFLTSESDIKRHARGDASALGGDEEVDAEDENIHELLKELNSSKTAALKHIVDVECARDAILTTLTSTRTMGDLFKLTESINTMDKKSLKAGDAGLFKKKNREIQKWLLAESAKDKTNVVPAEASADTQAHPLYSKVISLASVGNINVSTSAFEAKGGLRCAIVAPKRRAAGSGAVATGIAKMPSFKKAAKEVTVKLKTEQWAVKPHNAAETKKFWKDLKPHFDESIFTTAPISSLFDWAPLCFVLQTFSMRGGFINVGLSHMGMIDARMCLQGGEIIVGLPYNETPGETMKAKRNWIFNAPFAEVQALVAADGFLVSHLEGALLVVPSGFIVITASAAANTNTYGIRWSVSGDDADAARIKLTLSSLLDGFPELKNSSFGFVQYLDWLSETM